MIYADGSALRLTVPITEGTAAVTGTPESTATGQDAAAWRLWAMAHERQLATTELGLTDLRRAAAPLGAQARERARQFASRITILRIADQAMSTALLTVGVLRPFAALHLAVAVTSPEIGEIVTYDRDVARLVRMYALSVITPGRADGWWE